MREQDAQMSSIPSDMPSDREQELRQYVQANYGDSNISDTASTLPYFGQVRQSIKGLKNPATAYLLATIAAFVLYHLDRKYDIVCSMIFNYQHPKCREYDYAQYQRGFREKLHQEFDAYVPPE